MMRRDLVQAAQDQLLVSLRVMLRTAMEQVQLQAQPAVRTPVGRQLSVHQSLL